MGEEEHVSSRIVVKWRKMFLPLAWWIGQVQLERQSKARCKEDVEAVGKSGLAKGDPSCICSLPQHHQGPQSCDDSTLAKEMEKVSGSAVSL